MTPRLRIAICRTSATRSVICRVLNPSGKTMRSVTGAWASAVVAPRPAASASVQMRTKRPTDNPATTVATKG